MAARRPEAGPRRDATPEEAETAVHLAVTLVHWFITGAVNKK
jgi:hypothetical protein